MTSQKLNEEHELLRHFMAVVVSSAFGDCLTNVQRCAMGESSRYDVAISCLS